MRPGLLQPEMLPSSLDDASERGPASEVRPPSSLVRSRPSVSDNPKTVKVVVVVVCVVGGLGGKRGEGFVTGKTDNQARESAR